MRVLIFFITLLTLTLGCSSESDSMSGGGEDIGIKDSLSTEPNASEHPLHKLNLPKGFKISVFGEVENARSLAISPSGVVYVGNRNGGKVYALKDSDANGVADEKYLLASGLKMPNGVAFKDGALYVAEVSKIWKFDNIERQLKAPDKPKLIYDEYPTESHHGWKYIAFGPDGKLYVPVGAPCNICKSEQPVFASITRMNADGTNMEIVAEGVRNTVGFDWNPNTRELWFTDNGRDHMGDNYPPCELNRLQTDGQHFGYPYCHGGDIADPEFGAQRPCSDFERPVWNFGAHTAPLGMKFYRGDMFPTEYNGDVLVAQHGSWNRSKKVGYRVMRVHIEGNRATSAEVFIDGWLEDIGQDQWGRPVDILEMPDGSILLSDDYAGLVYRITYN
ncbi:sorbosone dehydrogenase family protein [Fulvivirga sp. M361]|uniref:PQQ-dependent sugar dehydrogenase n=1 Tax=Fulvivirga sp. M361 TaxID=2594266 RepID=UPI00117ACA8B|nr:sorbosone dehydrogenase family protein [Fulvivirga sp. M361]TRX48284.1 sorbosone dehydrogenase family protein [Fulvivirga sp. M361]